MRGLRRIDLEEEGTALEDTGEESGPGSFLEEAAGSMEVRCTVGSEGVRNTATLRERERREIMTTLGIAAAREEASGRISCT